jgi:hypothetical protein
MKKLVTVLVAMATVLALAATASATTLLSESFPYANGTALQADGWTITGTSTGTDITVQTGRAIGDMNQAPDDHRSFTAQPTTSPTYACFEVMIPDPGGSPKTQYFAHLSDGGTSNFLARVYVMPSGGANGFTFGLSNSSTSTSVGVVPWTATLSYGVSYNVVIKYDPTTSTSTLWLNPLSEASASISQTTTGAIAISAFNLRQSNATGTYPSGTPSGPTLWQYSVDNVGVGTTFADACYQVTPTRSGTWGQLKSIYR